MLTTLHYADELDIPKNNAPRGPKKAYNVRRRSDSGYARSCSPGQSAGDVKKRDALIQAIPDGESSRGPFAPK